MYQYKDHLGNIRLSYSDADGNGSIDAATEIIEENNYYPFGLKHKGYNNIVNGVENNYHTYNGKEFEQSLNLNVYDLGARQYDPAIGRFMVIDPMADFVNYQSPYVMADNNPVAYIDYYGLGKFGDWLRSLFGGSKKRCDYCPKKKREKKPKRRKRNPIVKTPEPSSSNSENNDPENGSNASSGTQNIPYVDANIGVSLFELAGSSLPELGSLNPRVVPKVPSVQKSPKPVRIPVPDAADFAKLNVSAIIPFYHNSASINKSKITDHSKKVLKDLVLTLKEYPHIKIAIDANYGAEDSQNINSHVTNNDVGIKTPIYVITNDRTRAVIKLLRGAGVNLKQLIKGNGTAEKSGGATVNFRVINE